MAGGVANDDMGALLNADGRSIADQRGRSTTPPRGENTRSREPVEMRLTSSLTAAEETLTPVSRDWPSDIRGG